ncbi:hypothetical protein SAMN04488498_102401 [Mesorhizobium albiziae]|uniref:Uncharacterized protein n=1 Tax=Neomesorhizobium albiziae TaxID=335020 RepID=A0A1I3WSR0_9HYPH|nr:hypothetical protein GCM10007937_35090 [Mesorhizobium albiziae]SFK09491.1 hypothetical protein SAMN04488498_102401 [Mesorhizobium albiziae]
MGDILSFQPKRSSGTREKRGQSTDATIIIFPGVRYERLDGTRMKTPTSGSKPRPSRH